MRYLRLLFEETVVEPEVLVDLPEIEDKVLVSVVMVDVELMVVEPEVIVVERIEVEVIIDSEVLAVELESVTIVVMLAVVSLPVVDVEPLVRGVVDPELVAGGGMVVVTITVVDRVVVESWLAAAVSV